MSEQTQSFLIRVAAVVVAVLILLFAAAVYQGTASVPGEVQIALWGLLVAGIGAVSVYINTRSNAATRLNSDRNAQVTQDKVEAVAQTLHNGLRQEIADTTAALVNKQAEVVATKLASELQSSGPVASTLQEIATNTEQIAANTDPEKL